MVTIYRGSKARVWQHLSGQSRQHNAIWLYDSEKLHYDWQGLITLIDQAALHLGRTHLETVAARHRPVMSFAFPELIDALSPEEQVIRRSLAADLRSHMTHNRYVQVQIFEAWAAFLAALLGKDEVLIVPDVALTDSLSLSAVRALYRLYPERAPNLILGYSPVVEGPEPEAGQDGIIWEADPSKRERAAFPFFLDDDATVIDLEDGSEAPDPETILPSREAGVPVQRHHQARAFDLLTSPDPLGEDACGYILQTIGYAFESFSFKQSLKLGLALLDKAPTLSEGQRASLHSIIGLSAHNRQFRSKGNLGLADLLVHHYQQALAFEQRPVVRCALCYRLAVAYGRRKKDFDQALVWADRAIEEAQRLDEPHRAYQGAWALNIRAYLFAVTGQGTQSRADAVDAYDLLNQLILHLKHVSNGQAKIWLKDCVKSQSVLASNLTKVAGDSEKLNYWSQKMGELAGQHPGLDKYESYNWSVFYRRNLRLQESLNWALRGREIARSDRDAFEEYIATVLAADIAYRLGKATQAASLLAHAQERRAFLGNPSSLYDLGIAVVHVYLRAGWLDEAQALLEQEAAHSTTSIDTQAETHAMLGLVAALRGDAASSAQHVNQAIDLAVASGERDTVLRLACLVGQCSQRLDRQQEATEAYARALEIIQSEEGDDQLLSPTNLMVRTLIGYQETHGYQADLTLQLVSLLPAALHSFNSEPWWDLARMLPFLTALVRNTPETVEDVEVAEALNQFITAASQRVDHSDLLDDFQALLRNIMPVEFSHKEASESRVIV